MQTFLDRKTEEAIARGKGRGGVAFPGPFHFYIGETSGEFVAAYWPQPEPCPFTQSKAWRFGGEYGRL